MYLMKITHSYILKYLILFTSTSNKFKYGNCELRNSKSKFGYSEHFTINQHLNENFQTHRIYNFTVVKTCCYLSPMFKIVYCTVLRLVRTNAAF